MTKRVKAGKEDVTFFEKKVTKKTFGPLRAGRDRYGPTPLETNQKCLRALSKSASYLLCFHVAQAVTDSWLCYDECGESGA